MDGIAITIRMISLRMR